MTERTLSLKRLFRKRKVQKNAEDKAAYVVASQWQLMWWKFKKHRMAMIAAPVIIILYFLAVFCEFISPYTVIDNFAQKNSPPTTIHLADKVTGKFSFYPFVYDTKSVIDVKTFQTKFVYDLSKKYYISLFVKGSPYKFWGLIPTERHLFGVNGINKQIYLMGTDKLGQDLFSRILYGARISLSFGLVSIFVTFIIGLLLGGLAGYLGGIIDTVIMRIIDLVVCIPTIPLWMALAAALPRDWSIFKIYFGMIIIMSLIGWTGLARTVRGKILSLREEDFTMAASLSGASDYRIITKHLLPSFASYIIVSVTLSIPASILGETSLSFLGLGLQAPAVSWGVLLQDAQNLETLAFHPWLLWPAAFIVVTVLAFNFLGDGLRDAADPYR